MRIDDDQLKELFQGFASSRKPLTRKGCPSPEALASSFESYASVRKKKKIIDHISGCSYCREEFMVLLELQKLNLARSESHDRGRPAHSPLWQLACVLLGVGLVVTSVFVSIHQQEISTIERSGKTGITLLSPKDDRSLSAPPIFRWQGRSAPDHYVLELFDESLLPVWASGEIRDLQIRLPSEVYATLEPGKRYFWMVTAFSPRAKTEESKLGRFIIHR